MDSTPQRFISLSVPSSASYANSSSPAMPHHLGQTRSIWNFQGTSPTALNSSTISACTSPGRFEHAPLSFISSPTDLKRSHEIYLSMRPASTVNLCGIGLLDSIPRPASSMSSKLPMLGFNPRIPGPASLPFHWMSPVIIRDRTAVDTVGQYNRPISAPMVPCASLLSRDATTYLPSSGVSFELLSPVIGTPFVSFQPIVPKSATTYSEVCGSRNTDPQSTGPMRSLAMLSTAISASVDNAQVVVSHKSAADGSRLPRARMLFSPSCFHGSAEPSLQLTPTSSGVSLLHYKPHTATRRTIASAAMTLSSMAVSRESCDLELALKSNVCLPICSSETRPLKRKHVASQRSTRRLSAFKKSTNQMSSRLGHSGDRNRLESSFFNAQMSGRVLTIDQVPGSRTRSAEPVPAMAADTAGLFKPCTCKNSHCLKLYCECFARGAVCGPLCRCQGCCNVVGNVEGRLRAHHVTLKKNPQGFQHKFRLFTAVASQLQKSDPHSAASSFTSVTTLVDTHTQSPSLGSVPNFSSPLGDALGSSLTGPMLSTGPSSIGVRSLPKGCHCAKSKCRKKYCECFQAGVLCGVHCHCSDCQNGVPQHHASLSSSGLSRGHSFELIRIGTQLQ